jgi:hypothetical protein
MRAKAIKGVELLTIIWVNYLPGRYHFGARILSREIECHDTMCAQNIEERHPRHPRQPSRLPEGKSPSLEIVYSRMALL